MRWLTLFRLRRLTVSVFAVGWMYAAVLVSLFRWRRNYIVERKNGAVPLAGSRRVAVFVHYDRRGLVHDYVLYYLQCLRDAGFAIVVVSNSPHLKAEAWSKLAPLCALMLRRENIGLDFGAYKDGIEVLGDLFEIDELVLANDSVYGPLQDLSAALSHCDPKRAAVWGITDNWFRRFHLQSYFLLFTNAALSSPAFARFWRDLRYVQSKRWIIEKYEIGLTQAMTQNGIRCAALYPYRDAVDVLCNAFSAKEEAQTGSHTAHQRLLDSMFNAVEHGQPLNSTHHLWDYLIGEMACPFLKRELLQDNPMEIPSVRRWEHVLRAVSNYDTDLILRHLEARVRNRAI